MADSDRTEPDKIARLLAAGKVDDSTWTLEERRRLLLELLKGPIPWHPSETNANLPYRNMTIGELLSEESPPLDGLKAVKAYAKELREDAESGIPPDTATYVYYACIAVAVASHKEPSTALPPSELIEGFRWCLAQPWESAIPPQIFRDALKHLDQERGRSRR